MPDEYGPTMDEPNADATPESPQDEPQISDEDAIFGSLSDEIPDEVKPYLERAEGQWKSNYTKKRQTETEELKGTARDRDQLQTIVDGLREGDPKSRRAYLDLLGVDQKAVLEAYDLEVAEAEAAEEEPQFEDDLEFRDPRVDQLQAERQQEKQERAEAAEQQNIAAKADEEGQFMEDEIKRLYGDNEPSKEEMDLIFNHALNNRDKLGNPDVEGGHALLRRFRDSDRQAWLDSRQGPRATMQGIPGNSRHDTSTKEGRIAEMREAAEAAMGSQ